MANFIDGVGKMIAAPFDNAWQMGKGLVEGTGHLLTGQFDKAWDDVEKVPGKVNDNWTAGLKPVIGDNWVSNNPLEAAGVLAGGVLASSAIPSMGTESLFSFDGMDGKDAARLAKQVMKQDPTFDFKGGGTADYSSYYQPGKTKSQVANLTAATKPTTPSAPNDVGMFDTIKQGISDAGGYVGNKAKALMPGKKVGDDTEVFGKIDEFTKPQLLNDIKDQGTWAFQGEKDPGAFDGYFKTGELDRLKQYSNIGATDWKEDNSEGWGAGSMAERGVDWRTSDQIREAEEKMNFIPDSYEAAKEEWGDEFDYVGLMEALKSVKPFNESMPSSGGRVGGGFRFNENLYKNKLLERELEQLYMAPLYNKYY